MTNTLKFWGWGYEGDGLDLKGTTALLRTFAEDFGILPNGKIAVPRVEDIALAAPRVVPPASLAAICTSDPHERILHAFGQSQPDSIRIFARDFAHAPDVVAYPTSEKDVSALFDWAGSTDTALIPYGGGSSVVGGVTPDVDEDFSATVTVDMSRMNAVVEVDPVSRAALIQGGARGPELEAQLKPHGLTSATSRNPSNIRRSAAGSPRARAAISRRSTRILMTWSRTSPWSRRPGGSSRADCRVPARGRVRTAS